MSETRIKICGMRRIEDIEAANTCRPDYIGFILSHGFRRSVTPEAAEQLARRLAPGILKVGVFVNESVEKVAAAAGFLDMIQLHGKEDNAYIRDLRGRMATTNDPKGRAAATNNPRGQETKPVIQAFRIRSADDLKRAMESEADYLLLDNGTGTGEAFDWSLIRDADALKGGEAARPWILAGGLGPDNVAEAVRRFRPYAVDLSSGAETDGWKDPEKMARCVQAVREAGRENGR
ncbi:MAG: phosphoribosylanthranilate isomerase [Lachnospiraceae bacterium]|nr:phosphoribosylanthranilate isomerase [Lachnospiraceae bacterium]